MDITIFDVAHGFCAFLVSDDGNTMLFDCGHNSLKNFRPSEYLPRIGCNRIDRFFVSNYDEDHISDLANLRQQLPIGVLHRNKSISYDELARIKAQGGPLGIGMVALLGMISEYTSGVAGYNEFPNVEIETFCSDYPAFTDTNNLSLVSFIHYQGIDIVFPGDLEIAGWQALLQIPSFIQHLQRVNIFVASHHGRANGLCTKVFDFCKPDIIIISDESIKYQTQQVDYSRFAIGLPWQGGTTRHTLTTRNDGMITIRQPLGYKYFITTVK